MQDKKARPQRPGPGSPSQHSASHPPSLFASLKGKQTVLFSPIISYYLLLQKLNSTLGSSLTCIHLYEISPGLLAMRKNVSMVGEK